MSNTPTDAELDAIDMAAQAIANQNPIGTPFAWRKAYLAAFASAVLAKWGTPQPVVRGAMGNKELQAISLEYSGSEDECTGFRDGWRFAEKHYDIPQRGGA